MHIRAYIHRNSTRENDGVILIGTSVKVMKMCDFYLGSKCHSSAFGLDQSVVSVPQLSIVLLSSDG